MSLDRVVWLRDGVYGLGPRALSRRIYLANVGGLGAKSTGHFTHMTRGRFST